MESLKNYFYKTNVWWVALLLGFALLVLDTILTAIPFLPTFADWIGEIGWVVLIVVIGVNAFRTGSLYKGFVAVFLAFVGYWAIPNAGSTLAYFYTRDHITGTLVRQYLDESNNGTGARNIFVVRDHATCTEESYVAQDEIIMGFGVFPLVYQDDSQFMRDKLINSIGKSVEIWDVHDRRYRRDMPVLGKFGGTIASFFGADFTTFPNITGLEPSDQPDPCVK